MSDTKGLDAGPLGPQNPNERRGHEFFTPSGTRVGYHGDRFHVRRVAGDYGDVQFDCPGPTGHCQINYAESTFVCDRGGAMEREKEAVALIHISEDKGSYEPLFYHGSSWKPQGAHPHPRFRPGDKEVVFTTDYSGLSNIYLATL
ncbi:MAG: hypothetical protein ACYTAN_18735 [Planctomycetota bacterium]|jgi:oligogalacturonide lyase